MGGAHRSPSWHWSPAMALPAQNVCMNTDVFIDDDFSSSSSLQGIAQASPVSALASFVSSRQAEANKFPLVFWLIENGHKMSAFVPQNYTFFFINPKYLVSFLSILDKKMFYVWSFCFFLVILHMDNKLEYAIYSGGVDTCVPMDIYHPQAACAISSFGIYYKLRIYLPYCFSGRTTILPLHRWKEPSPLYGCAS